MSEPDTRAPVLPVHPAHSSPTPTAESGNLRGIVAMVAAVGFFSLMDALLKTLSAQNRFALAFRVHNMKTPAGRAKKIETFVAMLKRGETIYPQGKP